MTFRRLGTAVWLLRKWVAKLTSVFGRSDHHCGPSVLVRSHTLVTSITYQHVSSTTVLHLGAGYLRVMVYPGQGKATNPGITLDSDRPQLFLRILFSVVCLLVHVPRVYLCSHMQEHTNTRTCLETPTSLPMSVCRSDENVCLWCWHSKN